MQHQTTGCSKQKQLVMQCCTTLYMGGKVIMTPISMKEYAAQCGISYEAVRKKVKQYAADLAGHVIVQNKTTYLDEDAIAILEQHRMKAQVTVVPRDQIEEIDQLTQENEDLKKEKDALKDTVMKLQQDLIKQSEDNRALQEKLSGYIADKTRADMLEEQNSHLKEDLDKQTKQAAEAEDRASAAEAENTRLKSRGFWARVFNK